MLHVIAHERPTTAVAFSATGQLVVSGGLDGNARVWEVASGKRVYNATLASDAMAAWWRKWTEKGANTRAVGQAESAASLPFVLGVALSADEKWLLTGCGDAKARLWRFHQGRSASVPDRVLGGDVQPITTVACSDDGRTIVSAGWKNDLDVWDTNEGTLRARLKGHQARITALYLTGDGRIALSGSADGIARVWNVEDGTTVRVFERHHEAISCAALSSDASLAITGSEDGHTYLWRVRDGALLGTLKRPKDWWSSFR